MKSAGNAAPKPPKGALLRPSFSNVGLQASSFCILINTLSISPITCSFENLITLYPKAFKYSVLALSNSCCSVVLWYPPSTSTTNFLTMHTKSTIASSIMCWRRNLYPLNFFPLNTAHNASSACVGFLLLFAANSFNSLYDIGLAVFHRMETSFSVSSSLVPPSGVRGPNGQCHCA